MKDIDIETIIKLGKEYTAALEKVHELAEVIHTKKTVDIFSKYIGKKIKVKYIWNGSEDDYEGELTEVNEYVITITSKHPGVYVNIYVNLITDFEIVD